MKDELHRKALNINNKDYTYLQFLKEKIDHNKFSQLYFIKDKKGNIPMDFIGRFENLQEDFNIICNHLDIEDNLLPKLLVREYNHYTDAYDNETIDYIYKVYKDEIDYFGFEYGE